MPKVAIVMGSDSDLKVMSKAASMLEKLGIDYEMTIISAHRMPDTFFEWAKGAEDRGVKVIIAGAGMAAHLPGMVRSALPDAGDRRADVRKEPGRNGCTLFDRTDAAGNPGSHSGYRRRYERGDPGSKDPCCIRSGASREAERLFAEMKAGVQAKADKLHEIGYEAYINQK